MLGPWATLQARFDAALGTLGNEYPARIVDLRNSSLFFFLGADFLMVWDLEPFVLEQGIVKPRAGLGYQRLLGSSNRWRLGLEIGAAWLQEVVEGDQGDLYDPVFPLMPHVLLVLGRAF